MTQPHEQGEAQRRDHARWNVLYNEGLHSTDHQRTETAYTQHRKVPIKSMPMIDEKNHRNESDQNIKPKEYRRFLLEECDIFRFMLRRIRKSCASQMTGRVIAISFALTASRNTTEAGQSAGRKAGCFERWSLCTDASRVLLANFPFLNQESGDS
jgi:hypothetical protein